MNKSQGERIDGIDDLVQRLKPLIQGVMVNAKKQLPIIRKEIDRIIDKKIDSIPIIERNLDLLLGYINLGIGMEEFKRLNDYYSTIHNKNAACYNQFYNELFEGVDRAD